MLDPVACLRGMLDAAPGGPWEAFEQIVDDLHWGPVPSMVLRSPDGPEFYVSGDREYRRMFELAAAARNALPALLAVAEAADYVLAWLPDEVRRELSEPLDVLRCLEVPDPPVERECTDVEHLSLTFAPGAACGRCGIPWNKETLRETALRVYGTDPFDG